MANKKITDLTELTVAASDDYLEIVDTSVNTSKKISLENLIAGHDHDSDYLGISAKAADSDKLDGLDSTAFLQLAWGSWTPTLVGWSSTTTVACKYYTLGEIMLFAVIISGTSDSTSTSFTLPETNAGSEVTGAMGYCVNNGSVLTVAARYSISHGSDVCNTYTDMASGTWTASGTKRISVYGWYVS